MDVLLRLFDWCNTLSRNMKRTLSLLLLFLAVIESDAQNEFKDCFVTFKNDTIRCKVVELKKGTLKFETDNLEYAKEKKNKTSFRNRKKTKKTVSKFLSEKIDNLKDLFLSDSSVVYNPLNIKIEEPEDGYAHVYFFRPYVYLNSALGCKIMYNDKKFLNIKTNGYFLHKIKAGQTHKYFKKRLGKDNIVLLNAENGKVYYIRVVIGDVKFMNKYGTIYDTPFQASQMDNDFGQPMPTPIGGERSISIDNSPNAKFHVIGMKKKLKAY